MLLQGFRGSEHCSDSTIFYLRYMHMYMTKSLPTGLVFGAPFSSWLPSLASEVSTPSLKSTKESIGTWGDSRVGVVGGGVVEGGVVWVGD